MSVHVLTRHYAPPVRVAPERTKGPELWRGCVAAWRATSGAWLDVFNREYGVNVDSPEFTAREFGHAYHRPVSGGGSSARVRFDREFGLFGGSLNWSIFMLLAPQTQTQEGSVQFSMLFHPRAEHDVSLAIEATTVAEVEFGFHDGATQSTTAEDTGVAAGDLLVAGGIWDADNSTLHAISNAVTASRATGSPTATSATNHFFAQDTGTAGSPNVLTDRAYEGDAYYAVLYDRAAWDVHEALLRDPWAMFRQRRRVPVRVPTAVAAFNRVPSIVQNYRNMGLH